MAHAGRNSNHSFADLRSASRACKRTRSHMEKYGRFRRTGLTRADLPSSPNQKPHYLPNSCPLTNHCTSSEMAEQCVFSTFPADLSTAPVAKFTKQEAYQEAQLWPRPPKPHHSRHKQDKCKWEKRKATMKDTKRMIFDGEHVDDQDWYDYEDTLMGWMTPYERYCEMRQFRDIYESTEDDLYDEDEGYHSSEAESESVQWERWSNKEWIYHRNFANGWFRAKWKCRWGYCSCPAEWNQPEEWTKEWTDPRTVFSLAEWLEGKLEDGAGDTWDLENNNDWDTYSWRDTEWHSQQVDPWAMGADEWWAAPNDWDWEVDERIADWDIVSTASEAWTEIEAESECDSL